MAALAPSGRVPKLLARPHPDVLVLERIDGPSLIELPNFGAERATAVGALCTDLHATPVRRGHRPLAQLFDTYQATGMTQAEEQLFFRLTDTLANSSAPRRLIHGDLTTQNLIDSPRGLVALDPHGLQAPPGWDLAVTAVRVASRGARPVEDPRETLARVLAGYRAPLPPLVAECFCLCLLANTGWRRNHGDPQLAWLGPLVDELLCDGDPQRFAFAG